MSDAMFQGLIVTLIVLAAAVFATWRLMPARRRLQLLTILDRAAARRPALAGLRRGFIAPRIARALGSGCAGCAANVRAAHAQRHE
jgi:hypothetical protein